MYIYEVRENIKNLEDKIQLFSGIIAKESFRIENNKMVPTIMLRDVRNNKNKLVTEHLWQDKYPLFGKFKRYDIIEFEAEPIEYERANNTIDYSLKINKIIKKVN
jgi:hypothetical protein